MQVKKFWAGLLSVMLIVSCLAGCSGNGGNSSKSDSSKANSQQETSKQETSKQEDKQDDDPYAAADFTYPMDGTVTLSINMNKTEEKDLPSWVKGHFFWDVIEEKTGVKLEYVGSTSSPQETSEAFSLLLTSGIYPDIMQANWITFKGGPSAAINDGYIIALNDYKQYFPALAGWLESDETANKTVSMDDGTWFCFPNYGNDKECSGTGLVVRQDFLDQINAQAPETVEEWYNVLTSFKNDLNVAAPLTFESRWLFLEYAAAGLSSPWGVCYPFFMDGDTVKFGPTEAGYKEFVTEMAKWYAEGLIDTDLASVDKSTVQSKFANGQAGIALQQIRNIQNCIKANAEDSTYKVTGLHSMVMNKGDEPQMGHYNNPFNGGCSTSISTQCKNIGAAARFLDYAYTEEGSLFFSYGEEGFSWDYVDGKPTFKDIITDNPETPDAQAARYFVAQFAKFSLHALDTRSHMGAEVLSIQTAFESNMAKYAYPTVTYTEDEVKIASKWNDIDTACREKILGFILGTEDLADWDSFIDEINNMGLQDVLKVRQDAYDRYKAR